MFHAMFLFLPKIQAGKTEKFFTFLGCVRFFIIFIGFSHFLWIIVFAFLQSLNALLVISGIKTFSSATHSYRLSCKQRIFCSIALIKWILSASIFDDIYINISRFSIKHTKREEEKRKHEMAEAYKQIFNG